MNYLFDIRRLKTTAGYAKLKGVTPPAVDHWVRLGKVKTVLIDGKRHIILTDEEMEGVK